MDEDDFTERDLERRDHARKIDVDEARKDSRKSALQYKYLSEAKAKRDVKNKNKRARRVHEKIVGSKRRRWWSVNKNFTNPHTCYGLGRCVSSKDVLPNVESLLYQANSRREEEILIRLVDRASRYVLDNKSKFLVVKHIGRYDEWNYRYVESQKDNSKQINTLVTGDLYSKIHVLNILSNKNDIPGLTAINSLCSLEIDEDGELELMVCGNDRKYGPRKQRLKSRRNNIRRDLVCRIPEDERVVQGVDDLRNAIFSIIRREAKADHYSVEANGRSELFLYLLKETQSRFDRGFVVDPDRMVRLDYAKVKRGAVVYLSDGVREYLKDASIVSLTSNGVGQRDSKPQYVNLRLLVKGV